MSFRPFVAFALTAAALGGCTDQHAGPTAAVPLPRLPAAGFGWRTAATRDDHQRISDWRKAWLKALASARPGHEAQIAAEGPLLDPDAALTDPAPPPGDYRCRTIKLGSQSTLMSDYVVYPVARCRIEASADGTLAFTKLSGSQRPVGRIFPENTHRRIFLGTLQLADEPGTLRYGHDKSRDLAALVERVGPGRWRMVFPYPHFESTVDVIELVPAS